MVIPMNAPLNPELAEAIEPSAIVRAALAEVAGAAIVLDEQFRIVDATREAEDLVGRTLPRGALAPEILCGDGPERPVAEALAAGRPVSATIRRLGAPANAGFLAVRAIPLRRDTSKWGWLLLLESDVLAADHPDAPVEMGGILTRDRTMKKLLADVRKVARTNASVLVRGETGSGKELVARAVHTLSGRSKGPWRTLNCAALPPALLESELFGHMRGAFTGAVRDQKGHVELAHGGTLFLDEVAELPLELQAKLLRVLQEKVVVPVGGRDSIDVDVRIVAATHRSLRREVAAGRFRADLMFRLRVVPLFLPPLRARRTDISLLAWRFIEKMNAVNERHVARLSPGALHALENYEWPGNVRELMNAIEYAFVMGDGPILTEADLLPEIRGENTVFLDEPECKETVSVDVAPERELDPEERQILEALRQARGNRQEAAALLGYSRITLWRKLKAMGLDEEAVIRHRRRGGT
jgi:transcriptional regulator with PAS, ATPase and Fis domain